MIGLPPPGAHPGQHHPDRADAPEHAHERADLAAAFRWAARLDLHEAVANHFSLAVGSDYAA